MGVVLMQGAAPFPCTEDANMHASERELAEAVAGLRVDDFRWLQESGMLSHVSTDAGAPVQETVSQARKPGKKRRRSEREWSPVGTVLVADYHGTRYEAEVIAAPQYKSGRAAKLLTGPAAGMVFHSLSGAMLKATESQRAAQNLGRAGVANGWDFWRVEA